MAGEPRKKSIIAVTVAAVGLLTLAAVIPVLAPDGVFAHTAGPAYNTNSEENSSGSAPNAGTREEYRETMLDMLRDHMGLEGSEAEEWADTTGRPGKTPAGQPISPDYRTHRRINGPMDKSKTILPPMCPFSPPNYRLRNRNPLRCLKE